MSDPQSTSAPESAGYPARLDIEYPEDGLNRTTTLFRIILVIPIGIVAGLLTNSFVGWWPGDSDWAVFLVSITLFGPTLLMILFRQKYPRWWFDWNLELTRFTTRVNVYLSLMRDEYPSIDEEQAVHLELDYPDATRDLNRWTPLVKWFLRDHLHRPLPPGTVRLRARRAPLGTAGLGLHVAAHHRRVPALLTEVTTAAPR